MKISIETLEKLVNGDLHYYQLKLNKNLVNIEQTGAIEFSNFENGIEQKATFFYSQINSNINIPEHISIKVEKLLSTMNC